MNRLEKLYRVKFMKYDDAYETKVTCIKNNSVETIDVGKDDFIVIESNLETFRYFGNGYRSIEYIGQTWIGDDADITQNTNYTTEIIDDEPKQDDEFVKVSGFH